MPEKGGKPGVVRGIGKICQLRIEPKRRALIYPKYAVGLGHSPTFNVLFEIVDSCSNYRWGWLVRIRLRSFFLIAATVGLLAAPSIANAESMEKLVQNGFKVSKITNGKSGQLGWNLTKGDEKYFCPAFLASAYIDSKRMYKFTSSGRPIEMSREVFDSYIGGPDPNIPTWKDVQVGHVKPADVKPCLPTK